MKIFHLFSKNIQIMFLTIYGRNVIKATFNKKSLIFKNWIKSNIIFVNDIIDIHGQINEETILQKLKDKTNWIS